MFQHCPCVIYIHIDSNFNQIYVRRNKINDVFVRTSRKRLVGQDRNFVKDLFNFFFNKINLPLSRLGGLEQKNSDSNKNFRVGPFFQLGSGSRKHIIFLSTILTCFTCNIYTTQPTAKQTIYCEIWNQAYFYILILI